MLEACDAVGLDDARSSACPTGLDTPVHERGASLSSGERQLLALGARLPGAARGCSCSTRPPRTSTCKSEAQIERALDALLEGRTAIIIAHRLATAMRADRIAVVDDGQIVELGSHDELVDRRRPLRRDVRSLDRAPGHPDGHPRKRLRRWSEPGPTGSVERTSPTPGKRILYGQPDPDRRLPRPRRWRPHLEANECTKCGALFWDRRNACGRCANREFTKKRLGTTGVVRSFAIVHQAAPGVPVPYVSSVVDLDGGGDVKANVVNVDPDPEHVSLGMKVQLTTFVAGTDDEGTEAVVFGFEPV